MKKIFFATYLSLVSQVPAYSADFEFAITADAGKKNSNSDSVRNSIKRERIKDLILPGDNLYESTYSSVWANWISDGFRFAVPAIGNHNGGYSKEVQFFQMPGEFYSKVAGDSTRFIVLNSDNESNVSQQAAFLKNQLEQASEEFIFIVYHHPSYTLSHFHQWQEKRSFQMAVRPILKTYREKITALIVGHDHLALLAHFGDLPVIVSGAVWETRRDTPINNTQDGVSVSTNWFYDRKPYWAKLKIAEGSDEASIEYIRANDDAARCTVTIKTGSKASLANCFNNFSFRSITQKIFNF